MSHVKEKWVAFHLEEAVDDGGVIHHIRIYMTPEGSVTHDLTKARLFESCKKLHLHCKKYQVVPEGQYRKMHRVFQSQDGSLALRNNHKG